jgi:hypothetical protein
VPFFFFRLILNNLTFLKNNNKVCVLYIYIYIYKHKNGFIFYVKYINVVQLVRTTPNEAKVTSSNLSSPLLCGHVKKKKLGI